MPEEQDLKGSAGKEHPAAKKNWKWKVSFTFWAAVS